MSQIELFDYSTLSPEFSSPDVIQSLENRAVAIEAHAKTTVGSILAMGRELNAARQVFGENDKAFGQWREGRLPWLQSRTALNFMQVDSRFGDQDLLRNNFVVNQFAPTILYLLSAPSTPDEVVEQVIEKAENGETVTAKKVKELKAKVKEQEEALLKKEREIAQKASEVANLKQANQFVTKQLEEQKEMVKTANSMMLSEAEKIAEKKVEAETKLLNQKLSELTEKVNQLETEKAQAEQANEEAKANYEKALEKFKANPDPETQKAISELKITYERTKAQVERVTHSLDELKHKEDQAFSASLSLERFNVAFQKLISNHPDAITAMSSRYLTDASLALVETIADTLDDWAHTIRNSLALAREERAKPIESVEVEVVTETPALKPVGADGYEF